MRAARTPARTVLMVLILSICACGGDDSSAPGEETPYIVGSYQGAWHSILAYAPPGDDQDVVCPGALSVDSQGPNGTFTGAWTQRSAGENCNEVSGTLSGIVSPGGAVTVVSLSVDGGGSGTTLEELTDGNCVATRRDDAYRGSADGTAFEISYAISGDCGAGTEVSWVTVFSGTLGSSPSEAPVP
ncbi:MAG: hypothetical protein M8861_10940 [marine benthic group bacterium]|nr:hypothetical protein [Gemmatimonadota bacterium]